MTMRIFFTTGMVLTAFVMLACQGPKGIRTVELPVKTDPTISFRIWFEVGSQNDIPGQEGLAALTGALISESSTLKHTYEEILGLLYPMAAGYDVSVDKEMTVVHGRVHRDHLEKYLELFMQAILEPAFREEDFERIKSNTLNNIEKTLRYSNDEAFGKEVLYQSIFQGTPYAHPEIGLLESVKSITADHVKTFYKSHFTRDNVVIGIGGGYDKTLVKRLKEMFSVLPPRVTAPVVKPEPAPFKGIHVLLVKKETSSTAISIGFPIDVLRGEKDFYALWIANSWLGEHRNSSSHLYQVIREARGMNYGDYSYIETFPDGWSRQFPPVNVARRSQIFEIWIRPVQNSHAHFALRAAVRELKKLVQEGMKREDFELTRTFLKKYHLHFAPTTDMRLGYKIDDLFYGIEDHLATFPVMLDQITLEDVNRAIKKYLQFENLRIAMITGDAGDLKDALVHNKVSRMEYSTPKPESVIKEDRGIEDFRLKIKKDDVKIVDADDMFLK